MKKQVTFARILSVILGILRGVKLFGFIIDFLDEWLDLI